MGPNKLSSSDIDPELSNSMDDPFNIAGQQSSSEIQEISRADCHESARALKPSQKPEQVLVLHKKTTHLKPPSRQQYSPALRNTRPNPLPSPGISPVSARGTSDGYVLFVGSTDPIFETEQALTSPIEESPSCRYVQSFRSLPACRPRGDHRQTAEGDCGTSC